MGGVGGQLLYTVPCLQGPWSVPFPQSSLDPGKATAPCSLP